MKKIVPILFLYIVLLISSLTSSVIALTPSATPKVTLTPTPTKESSKELDRIEKIKEMVASRVAELKLVEKRGIVGQVQETSNTQLTITDIHGNSRIIETDELTKFQEGATASKSFGISDIKKNDRISCLGIYNKQTRRLLARIVTKIKSSQVILFGSVSSKDIKNYSITVNDANSNKRTVDIELSTKTKVYKNGSLQKSGFSKIGDGEGIFVVGYKDLKDENVVNADRIIHFSTPTP